MAVITSATSGNFSAGATWIGGVVPGINDDAVAATGHTVTIDTNVTVLSFQQAGTGKFVLGGGRTVSGNVIANVGTFTSGGTIDVTATTGQTATINGNVTGTSTTTDNTAGIVVSGTGNLIVNGNVTGSAGNATTAGAGINTEVTCNITVNGTLVSGAGTNKFAIRTGNSSNAVVTVLGSLFSNASHVIVTSGSSASPTISVTGNVTGGVGHGIFPGGSSPIVNVVGNVLGGFANNIYGINSSAGSITINVTGNVNGNVTNANTAGINVTGLSSTVNITGVVTAGVGGSGIPSYGVNSTGAASTVNVIGSVTAVTTFGHGILSSATSNGVIFQGNLTDSLQGATAIYSRLVRMTATNSGTTTYTNTVGYPNGTPVTRVSPNLVTGMPAATNVRNGTIYGFNNELTGTMKVPSASSVALGVAVDNTVGTAALDVGSVVAVVGAQVAAASSNPSVV